MRLRSCLADSFWKSIPGSRASVRERMLAKLRPQSQSRIVRGRSWSQSFSRQHHKKLSLSTTVHWKMHHIVALQKKYAYIFWITVKVYKIKTVPAGHIYTCVFTQRSKWVTCWFAWKYDAASRIKWSGYFTDSRYASLHKLDYVVRYKWKNVCMHVMTQYFASYQDLVISARHQATYFVVRRWVGL